MTSFAIQTLPLTILPVGGILLLLIGLKLPRKLSELATTLCVILFVAAIGLAVKNFSTGSQISELYFPAMVEIDRFSWAGIILILASAIAGVLSSQNYFESRKLPWPEAIGLISLMTFGGGLMLCAKNLIPLFMGIETLSICAYTLAGFSRGEEPPLEASIKYFIMGSVASAFFLFGVAFYYGATGSFDLSTFRFAVANSGFMQIAIALIVSGIAFKAAIFPFQWWAPDVYQGAPLPVAGIFATTVKVAAILTVARIVLFLSAQTDINLTGLITALSIATMTIGNLVAITQDNVKRMLAYSSIAQAGYMLTATLLVKADTAAMQKTLFFYVVTYVLATACAFGILTLVSEKFRASSSTKEFTQLADLAGLGKTMPVVATAFVIVLMSLAGLPPAGGFFAKFYLFSALVKNGHTPLVIAALINSFISLYFYMKPAVSMFFHQKATDSEKNNSPQFALFGVVIVTALLILAIGIVPNTLLVLLSF